MRAQESDGAPGSEPSTTSTDLGHVLPGSAGAGTLPEDFPAGHVMSYRWSEEDPVVRFAPGIEFPVKPFLGVMAVAPGEPGAVSSTAPGAHGGNMDLKDLGEGTTLYLPVFVPGGLFSVGDAHAAQGDGEVSGTAWRWTCASPSWWTRTKASTP